MSKFVIVTGGSSGIGYHITKLLLNNSYSVIYTFLKNYDSYQELKSIAELNKVKCIPYKLDVSNSQDVTSFYQWFIEQKYELLGLVNNAGIALDSIIFSMTDEAWDRVIRVNLYGTFYMSREFSRVLISQRRGFIINIASTTGITGSRGAANYAASKGAVIAFTKSLGLELSRFGIRVNAIAPGFIQTDMISDMKDESIKLVKEKTLLKRIGKAEEVAETVVFLAMGNHYFQNSILEMDGGKV